MNVDLRLAIPAACGWIAAIVVVGLPGVEIPVSLALWGAAGALTAFAIAGRHRWFAIAAIAAAAAALCCTSIAVQAGVRQPADLVAATTEGRTVTVVAVTTQVVQPGRGSYEVALVRDGGAVPVFVFGEAPGERLGIGTRVQLRGTLAVASPGDDRAFLMFPDEPPEQLAPPPPLLDWANGLRTVFLTATQALPGEGGDLLPGLAIGDTSAVSDELDAAMKTSSLSHLTAVSGANCAVVIGLVLALGRISGMPRPLRLIVAIAVLLAFVVLVTPEPSVLRAAVMAALVLFALLGGRPVRGVPVLSLATLALLVHDPWLARNAAFALSVLATAGLLLLAGPLAKALERWLPSWLAIVVAVPVAAQLACQPVIILLDASLPTYGVVANLLAAPAAPLATVVGLAACVAATLLPLLGALLASLAWLPAAWIAAVADFFAAAPAARLPWPGGIAGAALLAVATLVAIVAALGRRRWAFAAVVLALVAYLGLVGGGRVAQLAARPADWQIAGCAVGQGDAFLVRSAGTIALIDTGPDPAALKACLDDLGIARIDLLVLTHYDLDHVGGTRAVLGRVELALVGPTASADDERILADLAAGGATVQQVARGPSGMLGELRWSVLWPPPRLAGFEPGNDASVTIAFEGVGACVDGCLDSVFLGDLGEAAQERLMSATRIPEVDVVKVSHHGSADQSAGLYDRLRATVGAIGVGEGNGYGHPTERLLDILAASGTTPVRTDEQGMLLLAPGADAGTVRVWTER
ncbi:ComEC/Rec2 family competence protein [Leifsonia sp. H3M29-4]|uniref:ComEC/Rec2 family competence protein n=1 Tax=Salinibacterium metalliresistens TaxID=3031321 RepID=UPI0023DC990C|nr:ComEC/Rec2 family competence protein [Salinibacterium metalliresistens]MDF1478850.1 ComEC/Rec2 family competence protein [Salinibacterium metalliresistens]